MRSRRLLDRLASRTVTVAATIVATAFLALGCSDGRETFVVPHFVTFRPANGTVSAIRLSPVTAPFVRDDEEIGAGNEGWGLSPDGGFGLVYDTETSSLSQIRFRPFDNVREEQTFFRVASFPVDGVTFAPGGELAILRQGNFGVFKLLRYDTPTAPVLSGDVVPSDPVASLDFPLDGRFGVFRLADRDDRLLVLDATDLSDPLVPFDLVVSGPLVELTFLDLAPDAFLALDGGNGDLRTFRYTDREAGSIDVGTLALGDPSLVRITPFRETLRVAIASPTEIRTVDVEDLAAPVSRGRFPLPSPTEPSFLAVSPDDRFLALADASSGRVLLYNLEVPDVPLLVGSFALDAPITDVRFTSSDEIRTFRKAPALLVRSSAGLSLVDLNDAARPLLRPPVAFDLTRYESFRRRDAVFLTGLDDSGRVVTYDVRGGEEVQLVGTFDLGIGGGLSETRLVR